MRAIQLFHILQSVLVGLISDMDHKAKAKPDAAAFDLKPAGSDFPPAWCEPGKSFPDKIRQQLQVLRDLGLLEFLSPGSYCLK